MLSIQKQITEFHKTQNPIEKAEFDKMGWRNDERARDQMDGRNRNAKHPVRITL